MSRIAAIGAALAIQGYGLAGALLYPAENAAGVRAAWQALPTDVALVVVTAEAATALPPDIRDSSVPLVAVMP